MTNVNVVSIGVEEAKCARENEITASVATLLWCSLEKAVHVTCPLNITKEIIK